MTAAVPSATTTPPTKMAIHVHVLTGFNYP
jgi:hypothetical protein